MGERVRYFLFSFVMALLMWSVLYSFLLNVVHPGTMNTTAAARPEPHREAFIPEAHHAITVLFMGAGGSHAPPGSYLLARFDPAQGVIALAALPGNMVVQNEGRPETLAEVFAFGGVRYTREIIEKTLGVPIDRHVRLTPESFVNAAAAIGGVEYNLPEALIITQDGTALELREGLQLLDGRRAVQILRHSYPTRTQGLEALTKLTAEIVNQRRDVMLSTMLDSIFERVINAVDSDISYTDYSDRKQAGEYLARLPGGIAHVVSFAGAEENGHIIPADTFVAELRRYFI
jgi:anionic cell wall polymer biosynthesis LytR-Cps2A-Psr (LCP) family protein